MNKGDIFRKVAKRMPPRATLVLETNGPDMRVFASGIEAAIWIAPSKTKGMPNMEETRLSYIHDEKRKLFLDERARGVHCYIATGSMDATEFLMRLGLMMRK